MVKILRWSVSEEENLVEFRWIKSQSQWFGKLIEMAISFEFLCNHVGIELRERGRVVQSFFFIAKREGPRNAKFFLQNFLKEDKILRFMHGSLLENLNAEYHYKQTVFIVIFTQIIFFSSIFRYSLGCELLN